MMTEQALSGDYVDGSGTITVRVKQCDWSAAASHPTATCAVDSDFVLISGGAEVEGMANPGALLWESRPDGSLSTWIASSKDHGASYSHRVRAYAVGLKLAGVAAPTLRNFVVLVSTTSSVAEHPEISAELPLGYALLGGGARTNWSGPGILLTSSHPDGFQWRAAGKDQFAREFGTVTAYAIGITSGVIPGFGSLNTFVSSNSTFAGTNYGIADVLAPGGRVLASAGGDAQYNGAGRLLTALIPISGNQARAVTKDHQGADSGLTTVYLTSIVRN